MGEGVVDGKEVPADHPLSFEKADRELCFNRFEPTLAMPEANLHFPKTGNLAAYSRAFAPGPRPDKWADAPPPPREYLKLRARVVDLHPMTIIQNARTSGGGKVTEVPTQALTVGPVETWKAERVSIWHAGRHDNPFGLRLTTCMISKRIVDAAVPMSLLADHPNVQFNFYRPGLGTCAVEMH